MSLSSVSISSNNPETPALAVLNKKQVPFELKIYQYIENGGTAAVRFPP